MNIQVLTQIVIWLEDEGKEYLEKEEIITW